MSYAAQTSRYIENDILTRSPEWLVPLMYEHLLVNLRRTVIHIENGNLEGRAESLGMASAIVGELLGSLDREKGGEIAEGLASLYAFFAKELLDVGTSRGLGKLPELIELAEELHAAWVDAAEQTSPSRGARKVRYSAA